MGDRYYKLIKKHKSPGGWLWDDDVDEILNKDTMVGCIENIQYDWESAYYDWDYWDIHDNWGINDEHKYVSGNVEPFYKYALKQAKHN